MHLQENIQLPGMQHLASRSAFTVPNYFCEKKTVFKGYDPEVAYCKTFLKQPTRTKFGQVFLSIP